MDIDGMVALMEYRDIGGESKPVMLFFKHGLIAEKFWKSTSITTI